MKGRRVLFYPSCFADDRILMRKFDIDDDIAEL